MRFLAAVLTYGFRRVVEWIKSLGSRRWVEAEATVTADPEHLVRFGCDRVEFPYTYRVNGELFIGLHEEPIFGWAETEYMERFVKGRRFLVRVKPGQPEVSVLRDDDQEDCLKDAWSASIKDEMAISRRVGFCD